MNQRDTEQVRTVFLVTSDMRLCLICESTFAPTEAAEHAVAPCDSSLNNRNKRA